MRGANNVVQVSRCMHKCVFVQQRGGVETYRLDHELRQCRDMMDIGLGGGGPRKEDTVAEVGGI